MISFTKSLTSKVDAQVASQVGLTRQNTVNPVEQTSSFDTYGRPVALATTARLAAGSDPSHIMCTETSVSRPQYAYYLNPALGMGEPNQPAIATQTTQDTLTGGNLGRHNQAGVQSPRAAQEGADDNSIIPYDKLLHATQKRYAANV